MGVNWNALNNAPNPGMAFMQSFEQARSNRMQEDQNREEREIRKEDRQRAADDRSRADQKALIEANREKIIMGAKLVRQVKAQNPGISDDQAYQMSLPALQQAGIDTSTLPPPGSPDAGQFVKNAFAIADALDPQGQELMAVAPGTNVIDKRTGKPVYQNPARPRYYPVQPGGKLVLDPSYNGGGSDEDDWEIINGGPTAPQSGGFL